VIGKTRSSKCSSISCRGNTAGIKGGGECAGVLEISVNQTITALIHDVLHDEDLPNVSPPSP